MKKSIILSFLGASIVLAIPPLARGDDRNDANKTPPPSVDAKVERSQAPLDDAHIGRVFEDTLGREPSRSERRRYKEQADRDHWVETDLNEELRGSREYRELTPEAVIRRAYRDLLNREPDPQNLRNYRRRMIEQNWSAGQVRQALRDSEEFQVRRIDIAIDRAYDDLLERQPDREGRERYRKLLKEGMSEQDMRDRLRQSVEYRVTLPDAKTTRAYRAILGHDPDAHGIEHYRKKIVDHGMTEEEIRAELKRSPEYQDRQHKDGKK